MSSSLGLIAGLGRFPFEVAAALRRSGRPVIAVAFQGITDPALAKEVDSLHWLYLGELGALVETFQRYEIRDAVMAGKIPKTLLYENPAVLRPDERALGLLGRLRDNKDDSILGAVALALEEDGIRLLSQAEFVPEILVSEGRLGTLEATREQLEDVVFAWPVAKALGALDIGQTVVVKQRAVLALEAIEGTDACIRRAGELGGAGACVVKVAKPSQDPRFDVPTVGPETLASMEVAGETLLAVEAGETVLLERAEMLRRAAELGIAILGVGDAFLEQIQGAES